MNHAAAPAPPPRGLLIKSAGLLTAVSPLCTWLLWDTLPAAALLAPLFLISIFAGTARAMKKNIHETFLPVLPSVWLTLAAGLAFTAVSLFSQAVFIWLPDTGRNGSHAARMAHPAGASESAGHPELPSPADPGGGLCMPALHRKENHPTGCWKNASHSLTPAFPGGTTHPRL